MWRQAALALLFLPACLSLKYCFIRPDDCFHRDCQRSTPCHHGSCDDAGNCVCHPCYGGDSCQLFEDRHGPSFYSDEDEVYVEDPWTVAPVYRARAYDLDQHSVCNGNEARCDCALVSYWLKEERNYLYIDEVTGEVFVRDPVGLLSAAVYSVLIRATGPKKPHRSDDAAIRVTFYFGRDVWIDRDASNAPLERRKREDDATNNQMTSFELTKTEGEEDKMEIGKTVCYNLAIKIPRTDDLDVVVEIFTKQIHNNSYLPTLALCRMRARPAAPTITLSPEKPRIEMILSRHINTVYDRAVIDFGSMTNSADEGRLDVDFCVAQIRNADTTYNQKHLVTAGAEYDRENYVWVGQAEVIPNEVEKADDVSEVEAEVTGPERVALDSAGVFYLDAWLGIRSSNVTVDISLNGTEEVVTLGHLGVAEFGKYFECLPQDIYFYNATYDGSRHTCTNTAAKLELGLVTNTGPMDKKIRDEGNKIRFSFAVYALHVPANVGKTAEVTASVWVGEEKLWSSVVSFTLIEKKKDAQPPLHAVEMTAHPQEDRQAAVGGLVPYLLLIQLDGVGGYFHPLIRVEVPREDGPIQMEPCGARLMKAVDSFDVPYVPCDADADPEYDGDKTFLIQLKRLHVTEQRSPAKFNDSLIVVQLIVKVSSDADTSAGSLLPLKVSVQTSGGFVQVPVGRVKVMKTKNQPVPSVEVKNAASWEMLHGGGAVSFDVVVDVAPGVGYGDLFFEAAGDEDSILQICAVELTRVGPHLPCLRMHADDVNSHVVYSLKNVDSSCLRSDRASVPVGDVGAVDREKRGERNAFVVKVVASLPSCSEFEDDTDYELTVGLTIGSKSMWASEVKYTSTAATPILPENKKPRVEAEATSENMAPGYATEVVVAVHTAADSIGQYEITLTAEEEYSSVCVLRVKSAGKNLPCVEFDTPATYLPHQDKERGIKEAQIRFSALSNIGTSGFNGTRLENVLALRATVKISKDTQKDQRLTWKVNYGSGEETGVVVVTVDPKSIPEMYGKDPKAANLTLTPGDRAVVGAPQFITMDLELEEFFLAPITVKIINPDSAKHPYDVCLAGITSFGSNYPCLAPSSLVTLVPGSGGQHRDSADIQMGTVCNSYIDRENFTANLIQLKVALYVKDAQVGDDVAVVVRMEVGNRTLANLSPLGFKVTKDIEDVNPPDRVTVAASNGSDVPIRVRQRLWTGYKIMVPPHSIVHISVRIRAPVKEGRAIFTLHGLRLVSGGRNIPCPLAAVPVEYRLLSHVSTSQNDTVEADLGYFGNLGVTHVNNAEGEVDDDKLKIEALVELADHPESQHGSVHAVDCVVTINGVEGKAQQPFIVDRTGEEKPDLTAEVVVDNSRTFQSGDQIQMYASLEHSFASLAEPHDVTLRLYTPPYVVFESATSWNPIKPTFKNESGGLDVTFPLLTFPDRVEVNFTVLADPYRQRKHGKGVIMATTPYRILCRQTPRSEPVPNPAKDGLFDCAPMSHLLYDINSAACNDKLGLDDPQALEDCQFTASAAASKEWAPYYARITEKGTKAWSPPVRTGIHQHYLQVDFLRNVRVGSVVLQRLEELRYVTEFKLMYSKSGVDWIPAIQAGVEYKGDMSVTELSMPVVGRFYRLVVLKNNDPNDLSKNVAVRMELYGCVVDQEIFVRCSPDNTWYTDDQKKVGRHMVLNAESDRIYFCDARENSEKKMCYSSSDGINWNILPWNIGSLLGYDTETKLVYAVDNRNWAYVATNDSSQWAFVKKNEASNIRGRNSFVPRINVPAVTRKELGTVSVGKWTATVDGLSYEGVPRAKWDQCCSR